MISKYSTIFLLVVSLLSITSPATAQQQGTLFADDMINPSMIGQTWHFKDGFNNELWILVEPSPVPVLAGYGGTNLIFHYMKLGCDGYWAIRACNAYLKFALHRVDQTDLNNGMNSTVGTWISIASFIEMTEGCPWCLPDPNAPSYMTADIGITPNGEQGYLIIPPSTNTQIQNHVTDYVSGAIIAGDYSAITTDAIPTCATCFVQWRTDAWTDNLTIPGVYSGPVMISHQWENCDPATLAGIGCAEEMWAFAPGKGLVWIHPMNDGRNFLLDNNFTMYRQPN